METTYQHLTDGEGQEVAEFIDENPGATYDEIIQHVIVTVPERVTDHLENLEGEKIRVGEDGHYLFEEIALNGGES